MGKSIALLRGVNVGGKNKISMPLLKAAFEKYGFSDVATYINSGNIIFSSANDDTMALQKECQTIIRNAFQMEIAAAVMAAGEFTDVLQHTPVWWGQDDMSKHNAIFTIAPADAKSVMAAVGAAKPEYEKVGNFGRVIFWSAPLKTFSRTRWAKVATTEAYQSITIRNINTTKKLLHLIRESGRPASRGFK